MRLPSQGARKVPVRFSVDNGIQNRAETVRLPPGSPTVLLRVFYGLLRVVYGLSAVVRSHENAGKIGSSLLSTPAPARLVKTLPGPLRIVGHPTGTLRVPHGNGQNYCFYSPYGALNEYVTAALAVFLDLSKDIDTIGHTILFRGKALD